MATLALTGTADVGGNAARLDLAWSSPASQARSLRIVRRRYGAPTGPDDGRVVFDLAGLFPAGAGATPWATVDRRRYTLANPRAECGVLQAELTACYAAPGDAQPRAVAFTLASPSGGAPQTWRFTDVTRMTLATTTPAPPAPFADVATVSIFTQASGDPETLTATLVVSTGATAAGAVTTVLDYTAATGDGPLATTSTTPAPNQLTWTPAGAAAQTLPFAAQAFTTTSAALRTIAPLTLAFTTAAADPAQGRGALPLALADASNAAPIVVTTLAPHGLATGASVSIAGVAGNTAANGVWAITVINPLQFSLAGSVGNGDYAAGGMVYPPIVREAALSEVSNGVTGEIDRTLSLLDREPPIPQPLPGLPAGVVAYYAAFQDTGDGLAAGDTGAASVLVTASYGFGERLFGLLPAVHRLYDDPAAGLQGSWQLRRYLGLAGAGFDQARSLGESLALLRDVFTVGADFLPHLAQQIGWQTDLTLPTQRQRTDVLFAPEVYGSIGTASNLRALAERSTGWSCQVKEFVGNVLLTNAVEPSRLWQIADCSTSDPATPFGAPDLAAEAYPLQGEAVASQAHPDAIDARPTAALGADGTVWLFWHSNRTGSEWQPATAYQAAPAASVLAPAALGGLVYECTKGGVSGAAAPAFPATTGATVADGAAVWTCRGLGVRRRRIWMQRLGVDPTPVNVVADLPDTAGLFDETPAAVALGGTILLAWSSNRSGHAEIWLRAWPGGATPGGGAATLVRQLVDNRSPALATSGAAGAPLWALWESTQAGETRIWGASSANAGATWTTPAPISPGPLDRTPAGVIDAGGLLHLYWSADGGDSSHLREGVLAGGAWTVADRTAATPHIHDQAPAATLWKGAIRLVWQSNRFGAAWAANTAVGPASFLLSPGGDGLVYQCTTAGTTGAGPPAFPGQVGASVADGSAVWTCRCPIAAAPLAQSRRLWSAAGPAFTAPAQLFQRVANDSQPALLVDQAGALRLFMTTQQSGQRYRSRTFDTTSAPVGGRTPIVNALTKASMGGPSDRLHYTYDTRRTVSARYARDAVGLFLTPADGQTDAQHAAAATRLRAFLSPFRPVGERLVYLVQPTGGGAFTPVEVDP